jgi:hypothetical protein
MVLIHFCKCSALGEWYVKQTFSIFLSGWSGLSGKIMAHPCKG